MSPKAASEGQGNISILRGATRMHLVEAELFGKIEFSSNMSDDDMRREICCVFATPMGLSEDDIKNNNYFLFQYLQPTGAGSPSLCVPSVSQ